VQALVEAGSPHAARVLARLISYLKAAVSQLGQSVTTIGREAELARACLELMQMRMPDRLNFSMVVEAETLALRCPPTALLVLVENAVRHGIDPSEDGGTIDITVRRKEDAVLIRVTDSGVGPGVSMAGLGTGLKALRERLKLVFGDRAVLRLSERAPHGVAAEVQFPAQAAPS
jgi:LytS/YehU family sensor histidine kinase